MGITFDGLYERGNRAGANEDAVVTKARGNCGLFLVSDGMGGHSEGRRASQAIAAACLSWWQSRSGTAQERGFSQNIDELKRTLSKASRSIWENTQDGKICGATVALLWLQGPYYGVLWAGDSRCYRVERRFIGVNFEQITRDDVWENQEKLTRGFSGNDLQRQPGYGKLIRAAGISPDVEFALHTGTLRRQALFLLCSDGVYKYVDQGRLKSWAADALKKKSLSASLVRIRSEIYQNRAPDNLSCILVKP
ncbi:MAG: serine/threonine-protein phosphatase [Clostridium sp.]|jgi:serine/threonine protein phosphatase PrpC|nr:serine/threonine-protein phosphatase [Clostridium sp.]